MKRLLSAFLMFAVLVGPIGPLTHWLDTTPAYGAYKASIPTAAEALTQINRQLASTKTYLVGKRAELLVAKVSATVPLAVMQHFGTVLPTLTTLSQTPGLVAYARSVQTEDPNYDVVAEFTNTRGLMVKAFDGVVSMFPKDANNFLLYQTINASGGLDSRTFTAAQCAALVALIDAVIASIE